MTTDRLKELRKKVDGMYDHGRIDKFMFDEILIALESAISREEWLPIESAPKDGKLMLYRASAHGGYIQIGEWDKDHYTKKPRPYWRTQAESWMGKLWSRENQPTHWRNLPSPP